MFEHFEVIHLSTSSFSEFISDFSVVIHTYLFGKRIFLTHIHNY